MTDVRAYLHYFQQLAQQHVAINSFFVMDVNEPLGAMRDKIKYPSLIMNTLSGSYAAPNHDNTLDDVTGGFLILGRLANIDDFAGEMLLLEQMKQIGTDIISRMNYDLRKCELRASKAIVGFSINSVSYQMADGIFDNCFGFFFTFKLISPVDLCYNAAKWSLVRPPLGDYQY